MIKTVITNSALTPMADVWIKIKNGKVSRMIRTTIPHTHRGDRMVGDEYESNAKDFWMEIRKK